MREYARQRGLRRWLIPVPVLTPRLSSLWLGLVTPLYARVGRKLIESLRTPSVVRDDAARRAFSIEPRGVAEAIRRALAHEDAAFARTRWSDPVSSSGLLDRYGSGNPGTRLIDSRTVRVEAPPEAAFDAVARLGGERGWYYGDWLWELRGFLDLLAGGVGIRRGRRHESELEVGDAVDFWRVEKIEANRLLRLRAEMRLPGRAWLQFETTPDAGGTEIRQTAIFDSVGLFGALYWYGLYPLHRLIFAGMLREIARRSTPAG
jgi:hypothetical protein